MADRTPDDRPRKSRAVRLSELMVAESAPLPKRREAPREDDPVDSAELGEGDPEKSADPDAIGGKIRRKTGKSSGKRRKSGDSAGSEGSPKGKPRPSAYDAAMNILACGDNSEKMLREKLSRKNYGPVEIADALELLREDGYVCDIRLMARYADALSRKKFYGAYRIRMEMLRRFDRAVVEENFADAVREIDFAAQAKIYAEKFVHKGREYLIRRLSYLGYSRDQIKAAVSQIKEDG